MINKLKVSSKDLVKFLATLNYKYHHQRGSHIILYKDHKRNLSIPNRKELRVGTFLAILKQAGSNKNEFYDWFRNA